MINVENSQYMYRKKPPCDRVNPGDRRSSQSQQERDRKNVRCCFRGVITTNIEHVFDKKSLI